MRVEIKFYVLLSGVVAYKNLNGEILNSAKFRHYGDKSSARLMIGAGVFNLVA